MPEVPEKFQGFGVVSAKEWSKPKRVSYEHKKILPTDVVVENICCGVCNSDVHVASGGWQPHMRDDLVVGHEIVGKVVAVGDAVTKFKIGQRVGIGPISASCGECKRCKSDNEQYCAGFVLTYNWKDPYSDQYVTQGGYASHTIAKETFVVPIPDEMESEVAAPLMCAGLTVYSPLKRVLTGKKNPVVGVIGIGGLGHLALQFAKAMGAETYAFSRGYSKKKEAEEYGVSGFIATGEEKDWAEKHTDTFDLILNCASTLDSKMLEKYILCLTVNGSFVGVGIGSFDDKIELTPFSLMPSGAYYGSSMLGSLVESKEMFELAAAKGVKPMIEKIPLNEDNYTKALERCEKGDVKYRLVFTDLDKAFK